MPDETKVILDGSPRDFIVYEKGRYLDPHRIGELESALVNDPENLEVRLLLLGYYSVARTPDSTHQWLSQMSWFIKRRPEDWITGNSKIPENLLAEQRQHLCNLWALRCEEDCENGAAFGRAGQFMASLKENSSARTYLVKAEGLRPNEPEWSRSLLLIEMREEDQQSVDAVFRQAIQVLQKEDHPGERQAILQEVSEFAIEHNNPAQATNYANKLLELASDRQVSHRQFIAHNLLGRACLLEGLVEKAESHLLEASNYDFLPEMTLANELLQMGRRSTVVLFLQGCMRRAGEYERQLSSWASLVADGQTPHLASELL